MSDSESDDQFESADEEFDSDLELSKNDKHSDQIINQVPNDSKISEGKQIINDNLIENLSQINFNETKNNANNVNKTSATDIRKENNKIEDTIKIDHSLSTVENGNRFEKNQQNITNIPCSEIKRNEKADQINNINQIEIEQSNDFNREKENIHNEDNIEKSVLNNNDNEISRKSSENDNGQDGWDIDDEFGNDNFVNNEQLNDKIAKSVVVGDTNASNDDGGVDGWDVEVEDGFEIPVDLTKLNQNTRNEKKSFSFSSPLQKLSNGSEDSWGNWGAWGGVGTILSTATSGVTTLTSQVSQGFSQVLGAPDPAELARLDKERSEKQSQHKETSQPNNDMALTESLATSTVESTIPDPTSTRNPTGGSGLFSLSHITRIVESTGSKVISGGLDTLENLGKKTMEVLQEGDPGLKKKRAILFPNQDKPNLSQVLRDAKDKIENEEKETSFTVSDAKKNIHFESLLDENQGLVNLEALEIISKQCSLKLHAELMKYTTGSNQTKALNDYQETLQQIREMCQVDDTYDKDEDEIEDDEETDSEGVRQKEFEASIAEIIKLYDLENKLNCDKLIKIHNDVVYDAEHLSVRSSCDSTYEKCLTSMAQLTSSAMDIFHKTANLLMLKSKHKIIDETDALTKFTYLLCSRITWLSSSYSKSMMNIESDSPLITNVYLEAANSCSYLQDASQLLIPIIQIGAVPIS